MLGCRSHALASSDTCPSPSTSSRTPTPVRLSARRLHALAVRAFRVGNRGRLSLCDAMRVLAESRLYLELGFPSVAAYAEAFFNLRRSESFEYVRVARALTELTQLREAFRRAGSAGRR